MSGTQHGIDASGLHTVISFIDKMFGHGSSKQVLASLSGPAFSAQEAARLIGVDADQLARSLMQPKFSALETTGLFGGDLDDLIRSLMRTSSELQTTANRFLGNIAELFHPDFLDRLESFNRI